MIGGGEGKHHSTSGVRRQESLWGTPKHQHIVPAFYLAGFSETGDRKGHVHVFNIDRATRYRGKPNKVGGSNHYYNTNPSAGDPVAVEKWMGDEIEGPASRALAEVRLTKKPTSEQVGRLLSLAAMIHARSGFGKFLGNVLMQQRILELLKEDQVTQEQWNAYCSDREWISKGAEEYPSNVLDASKLAKEGLSFPKEMRRPSILNCQNLSISFWSA